MRISDWSSDVCSSDLLFHRPTLAFKDYAMQLLGRLFDHVLSARGERVTIVGATSGDTGSAAIEAFRGRKSIPPVILHLKGRVRSEERRVGKEWGRTCRYRGWANN